MSLFSIKNKNKNKPETQKAKGVFFLENKYKQVKGLNLLINPHVLFSLEQTFEDSDFSWPVFARPCPSMPRHGFIDSRVCKNAEELNIVVAETKAEEADAELLVTDIVKSDYNLIVCGNNITIGRGNDGATAGKNIRHFYLVDDIISKELNIDPKLIGEGEIPFYEIVIGANQSNKGAFLVQARSAPGISGIKDFIPKEMTVKTIIKAEGDSIAWEKLMKGVDKEGLVVDHVGGSLSSHFAVHATINNIAIFTTVLPQIGDVVKPTVESTKITDTHRKDFTQAFIKGLVSFKKKDDVDVSTDMRNQLMYSLCTLHNFSAIHLNKDYELLGEALGRLCKVAAAVSVGEYRYKNDKLLQKIGACLTDSSSRTGCYSLIYNNNVEHFISSILSAYLSFKNDGWSGGYGGAKWATSTKYIIDIYNLCIAGEIEKAVDKFNGVIHLVHNNGFYLNKVIDQNEFSVAAENATKYVLKNLKLVADERYATEGLEFNFEELLPSVKYIKVNEEYQTFPAESKVKESKPKVSATSSSPAQKAPKKPDPEKTFSAFSKKFALEIEKELKTEYIYSTQLLNIDPSLSLKEESAEEVYIEGSLVKEENLTEVKTKEELQNFLSYFGGNHKKEAFLQKCSVHLTSNNTTVDDEKPSLVYSILDNDNDVYKLWIEQNNNKLYTYIVVAVDNKAKLYLDYLSGSFVKDIPYHYVTKDGSMSKSAVTEAIKNAIDGNLIKIIKINDCNLDCGTNVLKEEFIKFANDTSIVEKKLVSYKTLRKTHALKNYKKKLNQVLKTMKMEIPF